MIENYNVIKKENNSLNESRDFSRASLSIRLNIFELNITLYIYI